MIFGRCLMVAFAKYALSASRIGSSHSAMASTASAFVVSLIVSRKEKIQRLPEEAFSPSVLQDYKGSRKSYIERAPLSLEKLSIQDDIVTYTTKDGAAHEFKES
jgi:hypothetical protein